MTDLLRKLGMASFLVGLGLLLLCFYWCWDVFNSAPAALGSWAASVGAAKEAPKGLVDLLPLAELYTAGLRLLAALVGAFVAGRIAYLGVDVASRRLKPPEEAPKEQ